MITMMGESAAGAESTESRVCMYVCRAKEQTGNNDNGMRTRDGALVVDEPIAVERHDPVKDRRRGTSSSSPGPPGTGKTGCAAQIRASRRARRQRSRKAGPSRPH